MARRSKATVEAPVEEQNTEATEAPAEESNKESSEDTFDLTDFQNAANAAADEADESTGELALAAIEPVNAAYREIDGLKGKNAARNWLDEQMKHYLVVEKNAQKARSYIDLKDKLSPGSKSGGTKAPADPTQAFVQKYAALNLAVNELQSNVPEGVSEDWQEQVNKLLSEVEPQVKEMRDYLNSEDSDAEAPEVHAVVKKAFNFTKRGVGRGGKPRDPNAPRRDVVKHIEEAFADQPKGTFLTVGEIAKFRSSEYGDDKPSPGAISARLFPKGKEPYHENGIQGTHDEGKPRGATKTA